MTDKTTNTPRRRPVLGNIISEPAANITGIAVQIMRELSGNTRWLLQPPGKEDGTLPEALFVDDNMVDFIDDGVADRVVPAAAPLFELGDKVRDKVSGFEGVLTIENVYLNGCRYFAAHGKTNGKKEAPSMNLPQDRWEKIGVAQPVRDIVDRFRSSAKTPPGGPLLRGRYGAR